jgi:hypothetical protein
MQTDKAQALREAWGNKPCAHPTFGKDDTGEHFCTTCGRFFSRAEVDAMIADRIDHRET